MDNISLVNMFFEDQSFHEYKEALSEFGVISISNLITVTCRGGHNVTAKLDHLIEHHVANGGTLPIEISSDGIIYLCKNTRLTALEYMRDLIIKGDLFIKPSMCKDIVQVNYGYNPSIQDCLDDIIDDINKNKYGFKISDYLRAY